MPLLMQAKAAKVQNTPRVFVPERSVQKQQERLEFVQGQVDLVESLEGFEHVDRFARHVTTARHLWGGGSIIAVSQSVTILN